jgi:hypothetical protein
MYEAKGERASHIYLVKMRIANGTLVEAHEEPSLAVEEPES